MKANGKGSEPGRGTNARHAGGSLRRHVPGPVAGPVSPSAVVGLQRASGNAAVSRMLTAAGPGASVQRAFAPAKVSKKTRLHTIGMGRGLLNPRRPAMKDRGKVGGNIASQTEVIVDTANPTLIGRESWTKGVVVAPSQWDPDVHKGAATSLRGTKLTGPAPYPKLGNVSYAGGPNGAVQLHWHEDLGEFMKVADHPSGDGTWLVRRARDGERARYTQGAPGAIDRTAPTFAEQIAYGDISKKAEAPDGTWIVSKRGVMGYGKHDPGSGATTWNVTLTAEETRSVKEAAQEGAFKGRIAQDPKLADNLITTTDITYRVGAADITVHVRGNTADAFYAKQLASVRAGLTKLETAGVPLPDGLELYLSSAAIVQEAFHYGAGHIVLTPGMLNDPDAAQDEITSGVRGGVGRDGQIRGVTHQVADESGAATADQKKGIIGCGVTVHEVGHVMHRKHDPDTFFLTQDINFKVSQLGIDVDDVKAASKAISHYVSREDNEAKLVLEFVAEVFTGVVNGKKYPKAVIDIYKRFGGYPAWTDERTAIQGHV